MNKRIKRCFDKKTKKLITFLVINDPDYNTSIAACKSMIDNGADIVELGIPFQDPIAEGEEIEKANVRALKNGFNIKNIFRYASEIREYNNQIPLVFLTYYNILYKYGVREFIAKSKDSGIDGFIIPDLPYEESKTIKKIANDKGINIISLVSLTSKDRIKEISKNCDDFLYCVSSMGVTGIRDEINKNVYNLSKEIKKHSDVKKAIGFGISKKEHIIQLKKYYDAVIIGSAFVRLFNTDLKKDIPKKVGILTKEFKSVL